MELKATGAYLSLQECRKRKDSGLIFSFVNNRIISFRISIFLRTFAEQSRGRSGESMFSYFERDVDLSRIFAAFFNSCVFAEISFKFGNGARVR